MEEIDIKELLYEFLKNKLFIIILLFIGICFGFIYSKFLVKPMYKSNTTIVLSKSLTENDVSGAITTSDITMNQKLVSTYSEIMKSRSVVREVIDRLGLDISQDELISKISVKSKQDTELLEISVTYNNPVIAANIANTLGEVFTEKVKDVYNIENVSIIDVAEISDIPYNVNITKTVVIFAVVSLFIAFVTIFIKVYFNNTVKTEEEISKLLGLPVLAVIPELKE